MHEALKAKLRQDRPAAGRASIQGEGAEAIARQGPRAGERISATPASSATPSRWTSIDPNLDPVEDFLVNRKEGHCEYFASALALLLRSIDIPARMVNGFKGGDWNELTQTMNVRQKHAHSWVEAYVGRRTRAIRRSGSPSTRRPATSRDESVAQVGGIAGKLPPVHRHDPPRLGLLHRRLRPRPPESPALRADRGT